MDMCSYLKNTKKFWHCHIIYSTKCIAEAIHYIQEAEFYSYHISKGIYDDFYFAMQKGCKVIQIVAVIIFSQFGGHVNLNLTCACEIWMPLVATKSKYGKISKSYILTLPHQRGM